MHYRARSYDPRVGRFLALEPIRRELHSAHYNYAAVRPMDRIDPTGLYYFDDSSRVGPRQREELAQLASLARNAAQARPPLSMTILGMHREPLRQLMDHEITLALTEGTSFPLVRYRTAREYPFNSIPPPGALAASAEGVMWINVDAFLLNLGNGVRSRTLIHELGHLFWDERVKQRESLPRHTTFAQWSLRITGIYIDANQPPEVRENSEGFWLAYRVYPELHHRGVGTRAVMGEVVTNWTLRY
jgi:hypothetical protein